MNRTISKFKNILKAKLFASFHIFKAILQVKLKKKNGISQLNLKKG